MGVPKFYRFISERYPLINVSLNPPFVPPQIHNLYLDMNGIIHNCARSTAPSRFQSNTPTVKQPNEIYLDMFKYIDNIISILHPTSVLYLAIDGVAPRAKMNQQRARRFRSAKERLDEHQQRLKSDPMYAAAEVEPFDSNCITPGTKFMTDLTTALRYFVSKKVSEDVRWAKLNVILSGAEVPGEGEHKIMEYIRAKRERGDMDANTRHCVYGLDADLIMLGLITHEPHFFILREKVDFQFWKKKSGPRKATPLDLTQFGEFELLSIGLVREYLARELGGDGNSELPFFDLERLTDDFVFILMLIGNDFLPNLPTLDIADGTLSVMLHLYRRVLPIMGGYLVKEGTIDSTRLEFFMGKLALLEERVLIQKQEDLDKSAGERRRGPPKRFSAVELDSLFGISDDPFQRVTLSTTALKQEAITCRGMASARLLPHLKRQYYENKFGSSFLADERKHTKSLVRDYMEGVLWTLKYYTEGCRDWRWFYPHHYAPLASDVFDIQPVLSNFEANLTVTKPFRPLEQLMSVLPPVSSWCLPKPYQALMTSPASPIYQYYPSEFETDLNGKRNDWEAVVLLQFVDERALLAALDAVPSSQITAEERRRNRFGTALLYVRDVKFSETISSPFGPQMPAISSQARSCNLSIPRLAPGTPFKAALLPGSKPAGATQNMADLPTLTEFQHTARLETIGVNVFGTSSRSDSLVLLMSGDNETKSNIDPAILSMGEPLSQRTDQQPRRQPPAIDLHVGATVWFGYPWRRPGIVEAIIDEQVTRKLVRGVNDTEHETKVEEKKTDAARFLQDSGSTLAYLLQRYAIEMMELSQIVIVRPTPIVITHSVDLDNKKADTTEKYVPLFVRPRVLPKKRQFENLANGQTVIHTGRGYYYGHKCTVLSSSDSLFVRVQFDFSGNAAREPAFGYRVVSLCSSQERWMTISKLAGSVGLSVPVLDAILGSLRVVVPGAKDELDLGLGVKYIGRGLYIPGYARLEERKYYSFSEKCEKVIREFKSAFPDMFIKLEERKREESKNGRPKGNTVYTTTDLFPGTPKVAEAAAKATSAWLSAQDVASQPLVPATAEILPKETISELARHARIITVLQREYEKSLMSSDAHKLQNVLREALVSGTDGVVVPLTSPLKLGDRIINRVGSGPVPFGLKGTIVGLYPNGGSENSPSRTAIDDMETMVEVLFDEAFPGGGDLNGRCLSGRGKVISSRDVVVSRPERENKYYSQNYARVAARVGISDGRARKNKEVEEAKLMERKNAVSAAARMCYSEALQKGLPQSGHNSKQKQLQLKMSQKERSQQGVPQAERSRPERSGLPKHGLQREELSKYRRSHETTKSLRANTSNIASSRAVPLNGNMVDGLQAVLQDSAVLQAVNVGSLGGKVETPNGLAPKGGYSRGVEVLSAPGFSRGRQEPSFRRIGDSERKVLREGRETSRNLHSASSGERKHEKNLKKAGKWKEADAVASLLRNAVRSDSATAEGMLDNVSPVVARASDEEENEWISLWKELEGEAGRNREAKQQTNAKRQ